MHAQDISFDVHGLNPDSSVQLGTDAQLVVHFYKRAVQNRVRSEKEGTPIYESKDYVKIFHPGEKDVLDRPVKELDKQRFATQWANYQQKREQLAEGTPLEHLFPANPEVVAQLRALHIETIQQLAGMNDSATSNIPFGGDLKKKAKDFLEGAEKGQGFHALERDLEEKNARIKELEERLSALESDDAPKSSGQKKQS